MSADHRRPLFAFFVVASVCALLIGQGLRSESSILDYIVGKSASPAGVAANFAETVTLAPAPGKPAAPPASSDRGGAEKPSAGSGDGGAGDRRGGGDSRPGKGVGKGLPPQHSSGHGQGGGKPSQVDRHPGRGHGKAHVGRSRVSDDGPGTGNGKGNGKGHGNGHAGGKGSNQGHDNVPDHAQGPRH